MQTAIGVIGVAFPVHLVSPEAEMGFIELHEAARPISLRMGCPVYPFGGANGPLASAGTTLDVSLFAS